MLTRGLPRGTGLVKHLPKGSGTLLWAQVSAARPCQTEQAAVTQAKVHESLPNNPDPQASSAQPGD